MGRAMDRHKQPRPALDRMIEAETRGNQWLADGNVAEERGDLKRAALCFEKGQYWLDRYNKLAGNQ
jgi:hypothetical protein